MDKPLHTDEYYSKWGLMSPAECLSSEHTEFIDYDDELELRFKLEDDRQRDVDALCSMDAELAREEIEDVVKALEVDIIRLWRIQKGKADEV